MFVSTLGACLCFCCYCWQCECWRLRTVAALVEASGTLGCLPSIVCVADSSCSGAVHTLQPPMRVPLRVSIRLLLVFYLDRVLFWRKTDLTYRCCSRRLCGFNSVLFSFLAMITRLFASCRDSAGLWALDYLQFFMF